MEFLDIVNEKDEVVGRAPKEEIYAKLHTHRIVHVLVFSSAGELLMQRRSANASFAARHWTTSVGGHVTSGESYAQAALRETKEEIGVDAMLTHRYTDVYLDPRGLRKFLATFTSVHDGPFIKEAQAVEDLRFMPLQKVWDMIQTGEPFHPEFLFLLNKHYSE